MTYTAQETARSTSNTCKVVSGDTGWAIAKRSLPEGASDPQIDSMLNHIKRLNPGVNWRRLRVGQELIMPAPDEINQPSRNAADYQQERAAQPSSLTQNNQPAIRERYSSEEVNNSIDRLVRESRPVEKARWVLNQLPETECRRLEAKLKADNPKVHPVLLLAWELDDIGYGKSGEHARVRHPDPAKIYAEVSLRWYAKIIAKKEVGSLDTEKGHLTVVGLRGYDLDQGRHDNRFAQDSNSSRTGNQYNDTICFIYRTNSGGWQLFETRATTDPGMRYGLSDGVDVNADGRKDIAWLREGRYTYVRGNHKEHWGAARPVGDIVPVYRDLDASGSINTWEKSYSSENGLEGIALNIHAGTDRAFVGKNSAGCQVLNMDWDQFHEQVTPFFDADRNHKFPYLLVDISRKKSTAAG